MKTCTMCNEEKELSEFYTSHNKQYGKTYRSSYCKACNALKTRAYREADREKANAYARAYNIKRKYGIDKATYDELTKDGCEVCGSFEGLAVDHDHSCCSGATTCGKCVRGILCRRHNWAVANLKGSPEEAEKIAEYLRKTVA